jgi:Right handed beta helix region
MGTVGRLAAIMTKGAVLTVVVLLILAGSPVASSHGDRARVGSHRQRSAPILSSPKRRPSGTPKRRPSGTPPPSLASTPGPTSMSCTGVQLQPGANLQGAITANPAGTTFCLAYGDYTTTATINPKDGDRFIGLYTGDTQPNIANTGGGDVFVNGKNTLYEGLGIGPSKGIGLSPGTGSTIIGSRIHDNQMCGIETAANYLTITGNEIDRNGTLATKGNACGVKLDGYLGADSGAYNTVTNNVVHDNIGHGLWSDCDGHDNTFSGNDVYNNAGVALDDETSSTTRSRTTTCTATVSAGPATPSTSWTR